MIALIQRVTRASVVIAGETRGEIAAGLLALIGVEKTDDATTAKRLAEKVIAYRVFPDTAGKMNLGLADSGGSLLLVPQFTLVADTSRGLRPGFSQGAAPEDASQLFDSLVAEVTAAHERPQTGVFGADMQVSLCNDGPVTFWLQVNQSH